MYLHLTTHLLQLTHRVWVLEARFHSMCGSLWLWVPMLSWDQVVAHQEKVQRVLSHIGLWTAQLRLSWSAATTWCGFIFSTFQSTFAVSDSSTFRIAIGFASNYLWYILSQTGVVINRIIKRQTMPSTSIVSALIPVGEVQLTAQAALGHFDWPRVSDLLTLQLH